MQTCKQGYSSLKDRPLLTTNLFIKIVQTIRANKAGIRNTPGTKVANAKAQFLVDAGIAERKTAANYLKELEDIGILQNYKVGKEKLYMNKELFEVLSK